MNEEVISICIASYNTLSTRKQGLDACLRGLKKSIRFFNKLHPDVRVVVSWVDDASTDGTLSYVENYFNKLSINRVCRGLKVNSHQGYCRNLATKLVKSDYIMFCDSDDAFLKEHIKICYDMINVTDSANRLCALATTGVYIDPDLRVHPDWFDRIAGTIPITKIVRRDIWEFLEGFPVHDIYKTTGCEDQDFIQLAGNFFSLIGCPNQTVEYKCYKNSFFERQLPKFRKHPNLSEMDNENQYLHRTRLIFKDARLEYLKGKLVYTDWAKKLERYMINYI